MWYYAVPPSPSCWGLKNSLSDYGMCEHQQLEAGAPLKEIALDWREGFCPSLPLPRAACIQWLVLHVGRGRRRSIKSQQLPASRRDNSEGSSQGQNSQWDQLSVCCDPIACSLTFPSALSCFCPSLQGWRVLRAHPKKSQPIELRVRLPPREPGLQH